MKRLLADLLLVALVVCPAAKGQETSAPDEALAEELPSEEEDLSLFVTPEEEEIDIFDEFALLEEEIAVDEVESASKHRQSIFWSPSAITVLTREDIEAAGALTLADLLRRVPGMDVYEIKPSYPVVGARALTEESNNLVLTIIDGRESMMEFSGFTVWSGLEIDMEEIERIEVIRGPGSSLYGANAFAAVVSITTIRDRPVNSTRMVLSGGEEGVFRLFGRFDHYHDLENATLDYGISLGTEGRRSASERFDEIVAVRLRTRGYLRYRKGKVMDISVVGGVTEGTGIFFTHAGDMRVEPAFHHYEMARAEFALTDSARIKAQIYQAYYSAKFFPRTSYRAYDMWVFNFPNISWDSSTIDAQLQFDWEAAKSFLLIAGGNVRYSTVDWNKLVISDGTDLRAAAFIHLQWNPFDELQLVAGLRADLAPEAPEQLALSPRGTIVYRPWEKHSFRLGYGLAFRKPSIYESRTHAEIEDYNRATPEIVDKLAEQFGNESLLNEKVHSLEAGYLTSLLDDSLQLSLDLYINIYQDTITFVIDVPTRLGVPDIVNSTIQYQNVAADILAYGGEFELTWKFAQDCSLWANLGLRRANEGVVDVNTGEETTIRREQEPLFRVNLGGRYFPSEGFLLDLSLHYVSEYKMPLMNPINLLNKPEMVPLGDDLMMIVRLGYRTKLSREQHVEGGLILRTPLGRDFREYPGIRLRPELQIETASDFAGDTLVRILTFYVRGSF